MTRLTVTEDRRQLQDKITQRWGQRVLSARKVLCRTCRDAEDGDICKHNLIPVTLEGLPCPYYAVGLSAFEQT